MAFFRGRLLTLGGLRMEHLDLVPHFFEPGDVQDQCLELPIFVTRQVDDTTRRLSEARKCLLATASTVDGNVKNTPENG